MFYKLVLLTCLGAILEFFDFAIVVLFASELSEVFLPNSGDAGRLWIFAIYSMGNFSRIFGGVLFSHFGDRYGRQKLFRLSIIIMSISTLAIGLLPTYASIGIVATFLLAMFRMFQGLSVGGELPGAVVFAAEHVSPRYRGLLTSATIASAITGMIFASAMGAALHHYLAYEELIAWGWRIPFISGSALGLLGYFLRKGMVETPLFTGIQKEQSVAKVPVAELFRYDKTNVFLGIGLTSSAAAMVALYMQLPPYASRYLDFPAESVFIFTTTVLSLLSVLAVFFGWLSDIVGRKRLFIVAGSTLLLVAHPASEAMHAGNLWAVMWLTVVPSAIAAGCYVASLCELFSTRVRYTGLAVCLNIGVGAFGGCVPYILELLNQSGMSFGPFLLMSLTGLLTIVCSLLVKPRHRHALDEISSYYPLLAKGFHCR